MKPITAEWIGKAEGDFATVEREARARKNPNYDGVCFHAQQCAEKYLKALAVELDLPFLRTHDLVILLEQLLPVYPLWEVTAATWRTLRNSPSAFVTRASHPTVSRRWTRAGAAVSSDGQPGPSWAWSRRHSSKRRGVGR